MKRTVLITTGTLGGLGAVLAVTPPQFTQSASVDVGTSTSGLSQQTQAPMQTQTPTPTSTPKTKKSPSPSTSTPAAHTTQATPRSTTQAQAQTVTPTPTQTPTPTPTPTKTQAPQTTSGSSGTFTGGTYDASRYGRVSVTITVKNGEITQSSGTQSPSSWSQNVIPTLDSWIPSGKITISQIMSYSASELPCAIGNSCRSRASYTATAYWSSLQSALKKAGY